MAGNIGVTFTIGAALGPGVASAFSAVQDRLRQTQEAFRRANAESQNLARAMAIRERRDFAANQAREQLHQTGRVDPALRQELAQLNREYAEAARRAGVYGQSLEQIAQRQRELANAARQTEAQIGRLNAVQQAQNQLMQASQARMQALGSALATLGQAAALVAPLKIGADFEAAMSKVAAVSGAAGEDLAKLEAQARQLGATTEWSAKQAAEGMQFLAMAGFKTNEIIQAMPGMLNLASAGATDLGRAADIASNILSGMGIEASKMGDVADVLVKTFTNSNTTIESLGEAFKMCAPAAHAASQSIQDMAAMIGKLGDAGVQGTMAGTGLNAIIMRLASPPKAAAKALDALGVSAADAAGNMRPMPEVLAELGQKMSGLGEEQRLAFSKAIFGMEHAKSGIILMEQAMNGSLQKMAQSLNETGVAAEVARKQNDNLMGDLKTLSSATQEVGISLYNTLQPALREVTQAIVPLVQAVGNWINENPKLVQGITLVGGALLSLKAAGLAFTVLNSYRQTFSAGIASMSASATANLGTLGASFGRLRAELSRPVSLSLDGATQAIAGFRGRIDSLRASIGQTIARMRGLTPASVAAGAAARASGVAAAAGRAGWNVLRLGIRGVGVAFKTMFGPMSLVITAISLGVDYIIEHWDKFVPYFQALWDAVKRIFNAAVEWLKPIVETIGGLISPVIDGVKSVAGLVGDGINYLFGSDDEEEKNEEPKKEAAEASAEPQETPASEAAKPAAIPSVAPKPVNPFVQIRQQLDAMPLDDEEDTDGESYDEPDAEEEPAPKEERPRSAKKRRQAPKTGSEDGGDSVQAAPAQETQIIQPQVQVELQITQNGIPDAEFAQGVMNAIKSRQSELEQMISAIVNEQARLAYG